MLLRVLTSIIVALMLGGLSFQTLAQECETLSAENADRCLLVSRQKQAAALYASFSS
tara:strand:- start:775 stop:945 length:171 start_codon:yes stop_codon:yes gene_type:complete